MIWLIIIGIVILIISSNRIKSKKSELNESDIVLFNKYSEMMKGKIIQKRPENLTEWEQHIWLLAFQDRDIDGQKKIWKGFMYFFLALFIVAILYLMASR